MPADHNRIAGEGMLKPRFSEAYDKVHSRRGGPTKFQPTLAFQTVRRKILLSKKFDNQWIHSGRGINSCTESSKQITAKTIQQRLRYDAARGVIWADEQDIERAVHRSFLAKGETLPREPVR